MLVANTDNPIARAVIEPVKERYADFNGRTSRESFWLFVAVYFLAALCISTFEMWSGTIFMTTMSSFALMLPSLAITARRLHDINMSGWWQLIGFIPMIGLIILAYWLARRGHDGENDYGVPEGQEVPEPELPSIAFNKYDPYSENIPVRNDGLTMTS